MKTTRTSWADLSETKRRVVVVLTALQLSLAAWAGIDLLRRPAAEVRGGRKLPWALGLLVNFAGPIAYLTCGRRARER